MILQCDKSMCMKHKRFNVLILDNKATCIMPKKKKKMPFSMSNCRTFQLDMELPSYASSCEICASLLDTTQTESSRQMKKFTKS